MSAVRPSLASTHSPCTKLRSRSIQRRWHAARAMTRDSVAKSPSNCGNTCSSAWRLARSGRAPRRCFDARRRQQGDHHPAPVRRPTLLRSHRQRGRAVRSGRASTGAAAPRRRSHAGRRGHRSDAGRVRAPGNDRRQCGGRPARRRGQALRTARGRLRRHHRRLLRHPRRGRVRGRRTSAVAAQRLHPLGARRTAHRDLRLPPVGEADLHLGNAMTTTPQDVSSSGASTLSERARRHLWMHFTRMSSYDEHEVPIITRGEGAYVWDDHGKRYLDGLSGLFVTLVGHGRHELANAAGKQASELAYYPLWSYAHAPAVDLAERLAAMTPGDINRVFFTTGGSEAVETAWKMARQYFRLTGEPGRYKVISRDIAYHGTTMGALPVTGLAAIKGPFEPLVPGSIRVPNTNFYRAEEHGDDLQRFGQWAADEIERAILREGPESVAAVFLEPVQNSGGCFPPPPGYFQRVREICDRYGVLLVSDDVICAFGRLGEWFGAQRYDFQPDIITVAKGLTSGYSPIAAMLVTDRLIEPYLRGTTSFLHGITFAGHPVSCAVAMANLDIIESEDLLGHVRRNEGAFRATLEKLSDLPIVGDVRGDGYFYGIELVKDKDTKETFDDDESERLLRGFLSGALFDAGLICRCDERGDPIVQLAPPLICGQEQFDEMEQILRTVLTEAWKRI